MTTFAGVSGNHNLVGRAGNNICGFRHAVALDANDRNLAVTPKISATDVANSMSDGTGPTLTNFSIADVTVDLDAGDQGITFSVVATDDISGIETIIVHFDSPSGNNLFAFSVDPDGAPETIDLSEFSEAGVYRIGSVTLVDNAGNRTSLGPDELEALGFPAEVTVANSMSDGTGPTLTNFSIADVTVDLDAGDQGITFSVVATDDISGIASITVHFNSPSGNNLFAFSVDPDGASETIDLSEFSEDGVYRIGSVSLVDNAGNRTSLGPDELEALGFPAEVTVANSMSDGTGPTLTNFSIADVTVDLDAGDQGITFSVVATDDISGIASITVHFNSPSGNDLFAFSVDPDGASEVIDLSEFAEDGVYRIGSVSLVDNAGNRTSLGPDELEALGFAAEVIVLRNDAPTSTGNTVSIDEDTSQIFTVEDFAFSDVDVGDTFTSLRIDTLDVVSGTFRLAGVDVNAGQEIDIADISAGNLVYRPEGGANGDSLLTFTFSVNDGALFATAPSSFTVNVNSVADNHAPRNIEVDNLSVDEGVAGARIGLVSAEDPEGEAINFSVSDNRFEIVDGIFRLKAGESLDFETEPTVPISIRATDAQGASGNRSFTLLVNDIVEPVVETGGSDNDTINGGDGDDRLIGGDGDDRIVGGKGDDTSFAGPGDMGNDTVDGDSGSDLIGGGGGSDNIRGGEGNDIIFGGAGSDIIDGGDDNDASFGGDGNDTLIGGNGSDTLFGGAGEDTVDGGKGVDRIWAGAGDDVLSGGAGSDTFVFGQISGNDTVLDFNATEDILNLKFASVNFTNLADVQGASVVATQDGQIGLLIDLGESGSVFLIGNSIADLTADNVIF